MGTLTEIEVFDCLRTNLRSAEQRCKDLALLPAQGVTYRNLIDELRLIEGAARQVAAFRFDTRWTLFGYNIARFHDRLGDCIRSRARRDIFLAFAAKMRDARSEAEQLRTAKTGRRGPILPKARPGPHRDTTPVYIRNPSGLVMPASA